MDFLFVILWIILIVFVVVVTVLALAVGLSTGVFPGIFYAIKNHYYSVEDNVTHPIMKIVSYMGLGIGVISLILLPVLFIILSKI